MTKLIFLLLALVCYLTLKPTYISAHQEIKVIKMTPGGFEPQEIEIDENVTIIFKNEDKESRWPASNIHPTHDLYPEFDPKRELKPGESWTFEPKKTGQWKYHDHLLPHIRGKITVTGEGGQILSKENKKTGLLDYFKGLITNFLSLLRINLPIKAKTDLSDFKNRTSEEQFKLLEGFASDEGSEKVWEYIQKTYHGEAGSVGNIHDLAHLTGKLIFKEKGISGLSSCTPSFAFGCYHGLLDVAFATSLANLLPAETACQRLGHVDSGPYGSCVHGIGHGVASFHQTKDLEESLKSCRTLPAGHEFCWDGAFMEFARSAQNSFYKEGDPLFPCNSLEKKYGPIYSHSCGRNQPSVLLQRLNFDFPETAKTCLVGLSKKFKDGCFDSLGFSLAGSGKTDSIIPGCTSIKTEEYQARCLQAAAGELIFQEVPGWQEKSREVCSSSPIPYQKSCFNHLENLIKEYGREDTSKFRTLKMGDDKNEYVRSQMRICYESGGKDNCYEEVAHLFSSELGLTETLSTFAKNENRPEVYARCHEVTHYLSRDEYQKQESIAKVYAECNSTCHGGCYHGTLEAYLKERQVEGENFALNFPSICGKREDYNSSLVFNECLHGLGHAAMFVTDMEVPQSLALCDRLSDKDPRERCYSGIFMENSSSSTNVDHPGKYTKADDPLYPCNTIDQKYQQLCYRYQSSYFAILAKHDWKKVANLCLSVPKEYNTDCFRTVGTNQVGFTQDTKAMRGNCELMPTEEFRNTCIAGVISSFAYRFVGDNKRMKEFCESVPENRQEACFSQMGTGMSDWTNNNPKETAKLCNIITDQTHLAWCKQGFTL